MDPRLILADQPGAWTNFTSGGRLLRARIDPMWLGPDTLRVLMDQPQHVRRLFDERSQIVSMTSDPFGRRLGQLFTDYFDAVGLGLQGLVQLRFALDHLDLIELDLLREGLEIRDWLAPEGPLSSRRLVLLMSDWKHRPETCVGAHRMQIFPASKAAIAAAQSISSKDDTHPFLKSPQRLAEEEKQLRSDRAARERISRQQRTELVSVEASADALQDAQTESKRALERLLATRTLD